MDFLSQSRLILGTARYPSLEVLKNSILAAGSRLVTVSLRRQSPELQKPNRFWESLKALPVQFLPNTAGCRSVKEAVTTAEMARELFETSFIKLEVIGDDYSLAPDGFLLLEAAEKLIARGFEVFPYMTEDLVLAERLVQMGCRVLMPWGSPIGTGKGLNNPLGLRMLRSRFPSEKVKLILDAGIGKPSHAAQAMEMGFDAVLLNTAVATAHSPVKMAESFKFAVQAGRIAYESGLMAEREMAEPSTPIVGQPFWLRRADENNPPRV